VKQRSAITAAVLRVGDGRGFVVESRDIFVQQLVLTAAHCLPHLPPAHPAMYLRDRTFKNLLGPLGGECTVWAQCLFVDPMADIAVLGPPDDQAMIQQVYAYERLTEDRPALPIAAAPPQKYKVLRHLSFSERFSKHFSKSNEVHPSRVVDPGYGRARVLGLNGRWREYDVKRSGHWLNFEQSFDPGMSGSPILDQNNAAIGVVSTETQNPVIRDCLPAGLLRTFVKIKTPVGVEHRAS
jgi:hypothetical protein